MARSTRQVTDEEIIEYIGRFPEGVRSSQVRDYVLRFQKKIGEGDYSMVAQRLRGLFVHGKIGVVLDDRNAMYCPSHNASQSS
jgi:hypothetical protein